MPGVIAGVLGRSAIIDHAVSKAEAEKLEPEGFAIFKTKGTGENHIIIAAKDDKGVLYGAFHLLRQLQRGMEIDALHILENPKVKLRLLNHWDNLDGTVERG